LENETTDIKATRNDRGVRSAVKETVYIVSSIDSISFVQSGPFAFFLSMIAKASPLPPRV
jgi:hypothetical protein